MAFLRDGVSSNFFDGRDDGYFRIWFRVSRLQPLYLPLYQYTAEIPLPDRQNVLNACKGKVPYDKIWIVCEVLCPSAFARAHTHTLFPVISLVLNNSVITSGEEPNIRSLSAQFRFPSFVIRESALNTLPSVVDVLGMPDRCLSSTSVLSLSISPLCIHT